ncbi:MULTISPECIES: hypothetical protein [unclassified Streptomyces]|uniref:hypothetical protein n=1 Tax=unclassified Streptomyces TaxID=2593676 RepID=UPI004041F4A0
MAGEAIGPGVDLGEGGGLAALPHGHGVGLRGRPVLEVFVQAPVVRQIGGCTVPLHQHQLFLGGRQQRQPCHGEVRIGGRRRAQYTKVAAQPLGGVG